MDPFFWIVETIVTHVIAFAVGVGSVLFLQWLI